jgi:hypothetical protein
MRQLTAVKKILPPPGFLAILWPRTTPSRRCFGGFGDDVGKTKTGIVTIE